MYPVCLRCRRKMPLKMDNDTGTHVCACGGSIPYYRGIYRFVHQDEFYEGRFTETKQFDSTIRKAGILILSWVSIDGNEERIWKKSINIIKKRTAGRKISVLNVGSGGGHKFLKSLGAVTSVDLSMSSLLNAREISDYCYQADVLNLPFEDESYDLVFSSHLLGHIPLDRKQKAIEEIYRVTKKGGFSLHSVECEANNFIYRKAKEFPELYRKYFQDIYGHYGIEYPSLCKKRFREVGFTPIFELSDYCKGVIRPPDSYKVFFGEREYYEKRRLFRYLAIFSRIMSFKMTIRLLSGTILYFLTPINRLWGSEGVDSVKLLHEKL